MAGKGVVQIVSIVEAVKRTALLVGRRDCRSKADPDAETMV